VTAPALRFQRGQALVLGMLLAGVAGVAFVHYFSVAQMVGVRSKHLHALDAAAYSGALVQARALNMLAYMNTAQVGHQIAMAHLVTLGSWAAFSATEAGQAGSGNPPAHVIAMLFGGGHGAAYAGSRRAASLASLGGSDGELARAYAAHDDFVMRAFGRVQRAVAETLPDARRNTIQAVLRQNGLSAPRLADGSFDISIKGDNWPGFLRARSTGRELRPFIQQVADLYGFLAPRNHTAVNPWVVDTRCPWLRHELRRRGSTGFDQAGRWQSIDTQSFHALRANRWIGCYRREYPMGWGWVPSARGQQPDSPYVESPPDDFSSQDFWRWVKQATDWDLIKGDSNPLADSKAVARAQRWRGSGAPAYLDIPDAGSGAALRFDVELRHPGPEGLQVVTRSAAETFFSRPEPRADGKRERTNLFHPYWQARLATPGTKAQS
jgi:hypothetical protein